LLAVNKKEWLAELDSIRKFFDQFGSRLPDQLWSQHERLRQRLLASKA
jgi:GTP-dependent phosphoenolpyruvate carboxykinase